jgi:F0F1-type ATP synthase membrane subunit b/b'
MKRLLLLLTFVALATFAAQEPVHEAEKAAVAEEHGGGDPFLKYKWFNFSILAVGLGFLIVKNLGPYLRQRGEGILAGLNQAEERSREAAARAAEIDRKMSGLQAEADIMRRTSSEEMKSEAARLKSETGVMIAKAEATAVQEINSAARTAREDLKVYTSQLALDLAEKKITARMNAQTEDKLVNAFVARLGAAPSKGPSAE